MSSGRSVGSFLRLFLAGDVMIGRGLDQAFSRSVSPVLHEPCVRSARRYLELAEEENGPVPTPVDPDYPWGDALEELDRTGPEATVVNLETALTTSEEARRAKGIHYRAHPDNVACLTSAGVDVAVLANNHVLDWGYPGLEETLRVLEGKGVRTAGAGTSRSEARRPAVVDVGPDRRLLVFALATPTSGVPRSWAAGDDRPGVALLPELCAGAARRLGARIRDARRPGDLVVVSLHWGGNWGYRVPEEKRRFARLLVEDGGADLMHGHSSHHPKGLEVHRGRLILYGCGDLINDYEGISGHGEYRPELTLMYLPVLEPGTGRLSRLEMIPMRIRRFRLERAPGEAARWLRDRLREESPAVGGLRWRVGSGHRLHLRPAGG